MSPLLVAVALWGLFAADAGFSGWRAAAGRDGRIAKRGYYLQAFVRGMLAGQLAFVVPLAAAVLFLRREPALEADLVTCGVRLLFVYVPFTAAVALVFAVRAIPSVDVRSITSVVFFAPAVIARPVVIVAGVAFAIWTCSRLETAVLGGLIALVALGLGPLLDRRTTARIRSGKGG